jgi:MFS family permease
MWRLGFFVHEMAFGMLSVFLPLYIISIGGTLIDVGIMVSVALFSTIPASFFWGYVSDKTRRYKRYVLISFGVSTLLLVLFINAPDVWSLIVLYTIMSMFHAAHEAPKNVLIAELYSRDQWEKSFALYEGITELGLLTGLLLGFAVSIFGFTSTNTLLLCAGLNSVAFVLSLLLVADPTFIFERGLVSLERTVDFASRGVFLASKVLDGLSLNERLRKENVTAFCSGLVLFSLATSIFFTPMPVFIDGITRAAALPSSVVFAIFVLNSTGAVLGYFLMSNRTSQTSGKPNIGRIVMLRGVLAFALIATLDAAAYSVFTATAILMLMSFAYSLFLVHMLSLSMELMPAGKTGVFSVLVGIGGAFGSFIGPFIAQTYGFMFVFVMAGIIFVSACVLFRFLV